MAKNQHAESFINSEDDRVSPEKQITITPADQWYENE
jgi:hypothetical protein